MKTNSLAILALLKGSAYADVMMAKTLGGEDLALHGVAGSFHHVHKFDSKPKSPFQSGHSSLIHDAREACGADARHLCQRNDDFLVELMKNAAFQEHFPVLRVVHPMGEDDSLKLLNEIMPLSPPPMRVGVAFPDSGDERGESDVDEVSGNAAADELFDDFIKSSIEISKKVAPSVESTHKRGESDVDNEGLSPPEDVAEKTLEVIVNSFLQHASSASASLDGSHDSIDPEVNSVDRNDAERFDPVILSKRMTDFGKGIMDEKKEDETDEGSLRRRLARRLTEVTPSQGMPPLKRVILIRHMESSEKPPSRRPILGFGRDTDSCLWNAYGQQRVSIPCGVSLVNIEMEMEKREKDIQRAPDISSRGFPSKQNRDRPCHLKRKMFLYRFFHNFLLSVILFFLILALIRYKRSKKMLKIRRIIQAIRGDSELKAAVESAIDEDVDDLALLHRESDDSCISFCDTFFSFLPLVGLTTILLFTAVIAPHFVLLIGAPILGLTTSYMVVRYFCLLDMSSDDDDNDYVALEDTEPKTKIEKSDNEVYEGVPIQVV